MNWYRIATSSKVDLSKVTNSQWQQINSRTIAMGFDFRGIDDVKRIYEKLNNTAHGLPEEHLKIYNAVVNNKEYVKQPAPKKIGSIFEKVKRYFGTTDSIYEAGYILPDGTLIDFSGNKFGRNVGPRAIDHNEVGHIIDKYEFISMGAIRHFPEQPGVDIRKQPTPRQLSIIQYDADNSGNGYVVEIIDPIKGKFYKQYDAGTKGTRVINDISNFYNEVESLEDNPEDIWSQQASSTNWYKKAARFALYVPILGITSIVSGNSISSQDVESHFELIEANSDEHRLLQKAGRCIHWYFMPKTGQLEYWGTDPNYTNLRNDIARHLKLKYGTTQIQASKDLMIEDKVKEPNEANELQEAL